MGLYDTIHANCPVCSRVLTFQSKAGMCVLANFSVHSVPVVIAEDICGKSAVCECGETVTLRLPNPNARVAMEVIAGDDGRWD